MSVKEYRAAASGSEIKINSFFDPIPARSAACKVNIFAASLQTWHRHLLAPGWLHKRQQVHTAGMVK